MFAPACLVVHLLRRGRREWCGRRRVRECAVFCRRPAGAAVTTCCRPLMCWTSALGLDDDDDERSQIISVLSACESLSLRAASGQRAASFRAWLLTCMVR
jgi:hypothetical protein